MGCTWLCTLMPNSLYSRSRLFENMSTYACHAHSPPLRTKLCKSRT